VLASALYSATTNSYQLPDLGVITFLLDVMEKMTLELASKDSLSAYLPTQVGFAQQSFDVCGASFDKPKKDLPLNFWTLLFELNINERVN